MAKIGYSMKRKVGLSENQPKKHKKCIFSNLAQQSWLIFEIWTNFYVINHRAKARKRVFSESNFSFKGGVDNHHGKGARADPYWMCEYVMVSTLLREGAWVTRPERPKGAKDEVKGPEGPPTRSRGPEGPYTSSRL